MKGWAEWQTSEFHCKQRVEKTGLGQRSKWGQPHFSIPLRVHKKKFSLRGLKNHDVLLPSDDHENQFEFCDGTTPLWIGLNPAADDTFPITQLEPQPFESNSKGLVWSKLSSHSFAPSGPKWQKQRYPEVEGFGRRFCKTCVMLFLLRIKTVLPQPDRRSSLLRSRPNTGNKD